MRGPFAFVFTLVMTSGCSLVILGDATVTPSCATDDECAAGFLCVDTVCQAGTGGILPVEGVVVGVDGGTVEGPFGVTLTVPAGALTGDVTFFVLAVSATTPHTGFSATGPFVDLDPTVTFATPASLTLDGTGQLFRQEDGDVWDELTGPSPFAISQTGVFARGTPDEEEP